MKDEIVHGMLFDSNTPICNQVMSFISGIIFKQVKEETHVNNEPTSLCVDKYADSDICFQSVCKKEHFSSVRSSAIFCKSGHCIIADAVIHNRQELFCSLELPENLFSSISDSQLILEAYLKWGHLAMRRIMGCFVFAIWNSEKKQLFLARDPIGQRILFYYFEPNRPFCFASSPQLLFEQYKVKKSLNLSMVADHLALLHINKEDTFFKDIKKLTAGHYIIIDSDIKVPDLTCYWSAQEFLDDPLHLPSPEDYYSEFRKLYELVIAQHLGLADEVACQLSGGLDSSSVTCMAAYLQKKKNRRVFAFGHVPTLGNVSQPKVNWNYDDGCYMESVTLQYDNVVLNYIRDDNKFLFNYCKQLHPWLEMPIMNPCNALWMLACVEEAQRLGIRRILTGQGGNFSVSWPGPKCRKLNSLSPLKKVKQKLLDMKLQIVQYLQGRREHRPWGIFSAVHDLLARQTGLVPRFRKQSIAENIPWVEDERPYLISIFDYVASFYTAIRFRYGIDHCDPTFDRRIVEFCLRVPYNIFQNNGRSRLLIREGMRELLPQMIRDRTSSGMQAADWYKKVERQKNEIIEKLRSWQNTPIADYIDLNFLLKIMKRWNYAKVANSQGKKYINYEYQYRLKLLRAMETGLFIESQFFNQDVNAPITE